MNKCPAIVGVPLTEGLTIKVERFLDQLLGCRVVAKAVVLRRSIELIGSVIRVLVASMLALKLE